MKQRVRARRPDGSWEVFDVEVEIFDETHFTRTTISAEWIASFASLTAAADSCREANAQPVMTIQHYVEQNENQARQAAVPS